MNSAVAALAKHVQAIAQGIGQQMSATALSGLNVKDAAAPAVRAALNDSLLPLVDNAATIHSFGSAWTTLRQPLTDAGGQTDDAETAWEAVNAKQSDLAGKMPALFAKVIVTTGEDAEVHALSAKKTLVSQAFQAGNHDDDNVQTASTTLADAKTETQQFRTITAAWSRLAPAWELNGVASATRKQADTNFRVVAPAMAEFMAVTASLDEVLSGDREKFVGDQVGLFYFTDVRRLMLVLNSNTHQYPDDGTDPQAAADAARHNLLTAEASVSESIGAADEAKSRLRSIQEDIRLTRARSQDAANQAKTAALLRDHLKQSESDLQKQADKAATAGDTTSHDALIAEKAKVTTRRESADTAVGDAQTNAASTKSAQAQLQDESSALPQKLLDAQADLGAARLTLNRQRALSDGLAQIEADAFAQARDNAPFLLANASATSNDPAHRVILFAYPDSKTLYIRGLPSDVDKVKKIIAQFDRPAPQARITLWNLQFNGSDARTLNEIVQQVDHRLLLTRTSIGMVQDTLRDSLAFVVNKTARNSQISSRDDSAARLKRYRFYQPEVLQRLGYDLKEIDSPPQDSTSNPLTADLVSDDGFVTRFTLPDPVHATTLGEMLFVLSLATTERRQEVLLRFLLELSSTIPSRLPDLKRKDPQNEHLPKFAAALWVGTHRILGLPVPDPNDRNYTNLLLTDKTVLRQKLKNFGLTDTQAEVMVSSETDAIGYAKLQNTQDLKDSQDTVVSKKDALKLSRDGLFPRFPVVLLGALGQPDGDAPTGTDLSPNQNEILHAIQAQTRDNAASEIKNEIGDIAVFPPGQRLNSSAAHLLRMQYMPLVGWLFYTRFNKTTELSNALPMTWFQRGLVATRIISPNVLPESLVWCEKELYKAEKEAQSNEAGRKKSMTTQPENGFVYNAQQADRQAWTIAELTDQHNSLSQATPREAAADDMIKRMVITTEDDFDYFFVQPALEGIRQDVSRKGIEFGSFQRESLLATNRLVARVDPRANADLELPAATNFLDEASQLASIADRFRQEQNADKLSSSAPAALAGAASLLGDRAGTALGIGAVAAVLGDLFARPAPASEIYSINSGNLFKVTPIFDPSGQALRFQFDFAGTTRIREPDGSTNPSIPRVERHTVNTEVQLSNLELREISRFENNSSLGVPEQRTGGIPLIRHLPILRDIPIIGYYTRTGGQKAVRQQSLIFAQTSMYPTISSIVDLLVDVSPITSQDQSRPNYLDLGSDGPSPSPARTAGNTPGPVLHPVVHVYRPLTPLSLIQAFRLRSIRRGVQSGTSAKHR